MKALTLSLAAVLALSISSTASAWVVQVGPVRAAGRPAAVRPHRPAYVAPVYRPVAPAYRPAVRSAVHDRREFARETVQDRRDFARETIQERRAAAWDAFLNAQP
jgi:hypothetical protein